jgi:hypothetical protein
MLSHSLFMEPWWLDIVAPGRWREVIVEKNGRIIARMPYVIKKKYGLKVITAAPLTPHLGPCWEPIKSKVAKRIGKEKDLIFALVDQLPPAKLVRIPCHPTLTNVQPFYWRDFKLSLRYTYVIDDLSDFDKIWAGFQQKIRTDVRKAQRNVIVRTDLDIERFLDINALTFEHKGQAFPYSRDLVCRLDAACAQHNARKIFYAADRQDRIHAAIYIVWDEKSAYYLMSGGDPKLRNSGATSLLIWEAIQFASTVTKKFDFEGSMIESVERFFRAFGGRQTPSYIMEKISPSLKLAMVTEELLKKHCGPKYNKP